MAVNLEPLKKSDLNLRLLADDKTALNAVYNTSDPVPQTLHISRQKKLRRLLAVRNRGLIKLNSILDEILFALPYPAKKQFQPGTTEEVKAYQPRSVYEQFLPHYAPEGKQAVGQFTGTRPGRELGKAIGVVRAGTEYGGRLPPTRILAGGGKMRWRQTEPKTTKGPQGERVINPARTPTGKTWKQSATGKVYPSKPMEPMGGKGPTEPAYTEHFVSEKTGERLKNVSGPRKDKVTIGEEELAQLKKDQPGLKMRRDPYPLYVKGAARMDPEKFVRAKYRIQPSEVLHTEEGKLIPHTAQDDRDLMNAERKKMRDLGHSEQAITQRMNEMKAAAEGKYKEQMTAAIEARVGTQRKSVKEIANVVPQDLQKEYTRARSYAAGELKGVRDIIKSRRRFGGQGEVFDPNVINREERTLRAGRIIGHARTKLNALVGLHRERYDKILTGWESKLNKHLQTGIAKDRPDFTEGKVKLEATRLQKLLSYKEIGKEQAMPISLYHGERQQIARYLTGGTGRNITPEHVDVLKQRMMRMRDFASSTGEPEIRRRILQGQIASGLGKAKKGTIISELWKDTPKVPGAAEYPHLQKLGGGLAAAAVIGGGLLAAHTLYKRHQARKAYEAEEPQISQQRRRIPDRAYAMKAKLEEIRFAIPLSEWKTFLKQPKMRAVQQHAVRKAFRVMGTKEAKSLSEIAGQKSAVERAAEEVRGDKDLIKRQYADIAGRERDLMKAEERVSGLSDIKKEEGRTAGYSEGHAAARAEHAGAMEAKEAKHQNEIAALRKSTRTRFILSTAGAAVGGGGLGYLLAREKHGASDRYRNYPPVRSYNKRNGNVAFSAISNISKKLQPDNPEQPSAAHDIAIGAIEGGITFPISEHLVQKYAPKGSGWWRKAGVGGAVGGVGTGVIGIGLTKAIRKYKQNKRQQKQQQQPLQFQDPDHEVYLRPPNRALVARDRYIKQIHQRELDRANKYYVRSAGAGAALGLLLRKRMPLGKAAGLGAVAGLGAQKAARVIAKSGSDPYGEESWEGKRVEKAPHLVGWGVAGILGAKKLYQHKFSNGSRVIGFYQGDDSPQYVRAPETLDPDDPFAQSYRKWAHRKLYGRTRAALPVAKDIKRWHGRLSRIRRDVSLQRAGIPNVDARGRERKREWEKPWVIGGAATAALAIPYVAWRGLPKIGFQGLRGVVQEAKSGTRLGNIKERFASGNFMTKAAEKVKAGPIARFGGGVKEDLKKFFNKPVKPTGEVSVLTEKGKLLTPNQIKRAEIDEAAERSLNKILTGKLGEAKEQPFTPKPKKPSGPTGMRSKLELIQFQYPGWDIAHRSARTAVVYSPESRQRNRREKTWSERKENQKLLWEGALAGTGGLGLLGIFASRRSTRLKALKQARGLRKPLEVAKPAVKTIEQTIEELNPTPRYHTAFEAKDYQRPATIGTVGGGLALGTYALLRHRTPLPKGASPQLQKIREGAEKYGFGRVTLYPQKEGRSVRKGPTLLQKLGTVLTNPADIHRHISLNQSYWPHKFKGPVFDPDETGALKSPLIIGKKNRLASQIEKGKLEEYRATKRAGMTGMPVTLPVASAMDLKPNFVAKKARGAASKSVVTPEMVKSFDPFSQKLADFKEYRTRVHQHYKGDEDAIAIHETKHPGYGEYMTEQFYRHPEKFVQQKKVDIAKEYRVHLLGGKRLGISSGRYSVGLSTKKADKAAEGFLRRAKPSLKQNLLGIDIAKDTKGKFHIIETNPGPASGFLAPARKTDIRPGVKLYKRVTGRYSRPLSVTAAGGVGLTGAGATYAATRDQR